MITNTTSYEHTFNLSTSICFIDIETSGLSKHKDCIWMIGLYYKSGKKFNHTYWLCENIDDEKTVLQTFLNFLLPKQKLYSYNGVAFDYSFIVERAKLYNLDLNILTKCQCIDFKKLPFIKFLKQYNYTTRSDIESLISFKRTSSLSGKDLVKIINSYLSQPKHTYEQLIVLHNLDELLCLLSLYNFYQFLTQPFYNLPIIENTLSNSFHIQLIPKQCYSQSFSMKCKYWSLKYDIQNNTLSFIFKIDSILLRRALPYRDYYYVNNSLMHKSLSSFVPKQLLRKAKKEEAFIEQLSLCVIDWSTKPEWFSPEQVAFNPNIDTLNAISILKNFHKKITKSSNL
ncbi:MAG: ribonuclease H-like domain-containing protein [Cellulosilyticaceae bacterium]